MNWKTKKRFKQNEIERNHKKKTILFRAKEDKVKTKAWKAIRLKLKNILNINSK